ncbi:MAG: right-handed parallel beta-helix repeat-containing protein [Planctomycetota bacterium]
MLNPCITRFVISLALGLITLGGLETTGLGFSVGSAHAQAATDPRDLIPNYAERTSRQYAVIGEGLPGAKIRFYNAKNPVALPLGERTRIAFKLEGPAPEGSNLQLSAQFDGSDEPVAGFAHTLTGPDWVIDPEKIAALPAGVVELRAVVRVKDEQVQLLRQPFVVIGPEEESEDQALRQALEEVAEANGRQRYTSGDGIDGFSIGFPDDLPLFYVLGSGEPVVPVVRGDLPSNADVLSVAWSNPLRSLVKEYAHVTPTPRHQIEASRMDLLPPGLTMVQLLVRHNGRVVQKIQQPMLIVVSEPDASLLPTNPQEPEPEPSLSFAGPQPVTSAQPRLGEGWLDLSPSRDSRIIYVSSSTGDDGNDGTSPRTAVKTPARGYSLIRGNKPDWLLFKRGDVFDARMPGIYKSGRSVDEPLVFGAYGEGPRPVFQTNRGVIANAAKSGGSPPIRYIVFRDLHLYANTRDPANPAFSWDDAKSNIHGIRWAHPAHNIVFENLLIEYFQQGVSLIPRDPRNTSALVGKDFTLRRCVIRFNYGTWRDGHRGKSQGLYASRMDGVRIEGCIFDHNGWDPRVDRAVKNKFNHNIYISIDNARMVVTGNIITRAASNGIQLRSGGVIDGNLFAYNPIAGFAAVSDSRISNNVVLHGNDFRSDDPGERRGFGLTLFNLRKGVMENNIVAYRDSVRTSPGLKIEGSVREAQVRNNIVFWWHDRQNQGLTVNAQRSTRSNNTTDNYARFEDPQRTLDHWADEMGFRNGPAWLDSLRSQQKGDWREERTAAAVIEWVAEGFELDD